MRQAEHRLGRQVGPMMTVPSPCMEAMQISACSMQRRARFKGAPSREWYLAFPGLPMIHVSSPEAITRLRRSGVSGETAHCSVQEHLMGGNLTPAGTYPSHLALIRLGNVAAHLALRAQPRRKEQPWFSPVSPTLLRSYRFAVSRDESPC